MVKENSSANVQLLVRGENSSATRFEIAPSESHHPGAWHLPLTERN
jgi:hypothetical protein